MDLVKVSNGMLFEDNFNNGFNSMWDIFPYSHNRVVCNEDSISIMPGEYIEMLLNTPATEFEMYAKIAYISNLQSDQAGCMIKSVTGEVIECELSYENNINTISHIKLKRNSNGNVYLRASSDGIVWLDYGNTYFKDGYSVGFFNDSFNSQLDIDNVVIYKNDNVVINGVSSTDTISLYHNGVDITLDKTVDLSVNGNRATLDLCNCIIPLNDCKIVINEGSANESSIIVDKLYGGDVFEFSPDMYFTIEDVDGNDTYNFNLGQINQHEKTFIICLHNNSNDTRYGKICVEPVSSYDKGFNMVSLQPIGADASDGTKELECVVIPGGTFKCLMTIKKDSTLVTIDEDFNFSLTFV